MTLKNIYWKQFLGTLLIVTSFLGTAQGRGTGGGGKVRYDQSSETTSLSDLLNDKSDEDLTEVGELIQYDFVREASEKDMDDAELDDESDLVDSDLLVVENDSSGVVLVHKGSLSIRDSNVAQ